MAERQVPVLYIDLDGTVRHGLDELGRFVNGPDDVVIFDGVRELLWEHRNRGWRIAGVTNQGGIALGHVSFSNVAAAIFRTQELVGDAFDKIVMCQHHPDAVDPVMAVCWCRKPRIGLVVDAAMTMAEEHPGEIYPPHLALFVGDRPEDEACAAGAGIRFMSAADWRKGWFFDPVRGLARHGG